MKLKFLSKPTMSIILRSCILIFTAALLFFVSYFIGLKNSKEISMNKHIKIHHFMRHRNMDKKVVLLPKTPGRDETNPLINPPDNNKVAYLTFDDGPSPNNTPIILDTLKSNNIKATFFIIGKNALSNPEILKRERAQGETIGMHSFCHIPAIIYKNPQAYLNDLNQCSDAMTKILGKNGYDRWLIRFPYGSFAVKNKPGFANAIANAGYHYIDWNALDGDAERSTMASQSYLVNRFESTIGKQHHVIILMHDAAAKRSTAAALPIFIQYLKANGFTFKTIPEFQ